MTHLDIFYQCIIDVSALRKEETATRTEFVEEKEFLILWDKKQNQFSYLFPYNSCIIFREYSDEQFLSKITLID